MPPFIVRCINCIEKFFPKNSRKLQKDVIWCNCNCAAQISGDLIKDVAGYTFPRDRAKLVGRITFLSCLIVAINNNNNYIIIIINNLLSLFVEHEESIRRNKKHEEEMERRRRHKSLQLNTQLHYSEGAASPMLLTPPILTPSYEVTAVKLFILNSSFF